jgi:hypothetical protein
MAFAIIFLIGLVVFLPALIIGGLGFKRRFENDVFGRIYVWDKPWVLVTHDEFVTRCYEKLQKRFVVYAGVVLVLYMVVIAVVL